MRIKKLTVKDFGRHKNLSVDINAPVVGLLGANGAGKSTLLKLVEFMFTGVLDDRQESYIRDYGSATGAKTAECTLTFEKHGKEGQIYRKIGKTSKRSLQWDGREITAAAEVDTMLADILQADKKALQAALFIRQGELDKLIYGTAAERDELLDRLLLLSYLDYNAARVDDECKRLASGIEDLSVVEDTLNEQRRQSEHRVRTLRASLAGLPDYEHSIQEVETHRDLLHSVARTEREGSLADSDLQSAEARLTQLLDTCPEVFRPLVKDGSASEKSTRLADELARAHKTLSGLRDSAYKISRYLSERSKYDSAEEEADGIRKTLNDLKKDQEALPPPMTEAEQSRIREIEKGRSTLQGLKTRHGELRDAVRTSAQNLSELKARQAQVLAEEVPPVDESIGHEIHMLELRLSLIAQLENQVSGKCPLCLNTDLSQLTSEVIASDREKLEGLRRRRTEQEAAVRKHQQDLEKLTAEVTKTQQESARLLQEMQETNTRIDALEQSIPANWEELLTAEAIDREAAGSRREINGKLHTLNTRLQQLEPVLSRPAPACADINGYAPTKEQVEQLEAEIGRKQELSERLSSYLKVVEDSVKAVETATVQKRRALQTWEDAKRAAVQFAYSEHFRGEELTLPIQTAEECNDALQILRGKQNEREEFAGRVKQADEEVERIRDEQIRLEERIAENRQKNEVLQQLRLVKETLSRTALPAAYRQHRFNQLAAIAQTHLEEMGADFAVRPDPEVPASFLFCRLSDTTDVWMPQTKLSGGQRVRLTIAFLMAVQQLILPEVGFLVLDEPTTHLDDDGVQNLAQLFRTISARLDNADAQLIVCDHKPELEMAFGATIRL